MWTGRGQICVGGQRAGADPTDSPLAGIRINKVPFVLMFLDARVEMTVISGVDFLTKITYPFDL